MARATRCPASSRLGIALASSAASCSTPRSSMAIRRLLRLPPDALGERGSDPLLRRNPAHPDLQPVETALEPEVAAVPRPRIDVLTVDPHGRGAEEALRLSRLRRLDTAQLDRILYAGVAHQLLELRLQSLIARATVEIQEFDLHACSLSARERRLRSRRATTATISTAATAITPAPMPSTAARVRPPSPSVSAGRPAQQTTATTAAPSGTRLNPDDRRRPGSAISTRLPRFAGTRPRARRCSPIVRAPSRSRSRLACRQRGRRPSGARGASRRTRTSADRRGGSRRAIGPALRAPRSPPLTALGPRRAPRSAGVSGRPAHGSTSPRARPGSALTRGGRARLGGPVQSYHAYLI